MELFYQFWEIIKLQKIVKIIQIPYSLVRQKWWVQFEKQKKPCSGQQKSHEDLYLSINIGQEDGHNTDADFFSSHVCIPMYVHTDNPQLCVSQLPEFVSVVVKPNYNSDEMIIGEFY